MDLFMKEGDLWEKLYLKEQYDPEEVEEIRTQRGHSIFKRIETMSRRNSNFAGKEGFRMKNSNLSAYSGAGERLLPKSPMSSN